MIDADPRRQLGAFVRTRRESLRPEAPGGRRRTPGLRREELAARAGIGTTWVTWIEQGREVNPSAHTLDRLARGLALTPAERAYLFSLAGRHDPAQGGPQAAPEAIAALVQSLQIPAYGLDPAWNVLCINAPARDLFVGLCDEAPANLLRYVFTHPAARALLPDWHDRCDRVIAEFRRDYGQGMGDARVRAVVEHLGALSPDFATRWDRQTVATREGGLRRFRHPVHGELGFVQHALCDATRGDFRLIALIPAG